MNTDIRLNTAFYEHPKFASLADRCGMHGCFCLVILWCAAAKTKPDGNLGKITRSNIAFMARWSGDSDEFVDALLECQLLDQHKDGSFHIHDWKDHNAYAASAKERREKARKASFSRKSNSSSEDEDSPYTDDDNFNPTCDATDSSTNGQNVQMGQNDPSKCTMGQNDPAYARFENVHMHDSTVQVHDSTVQMHDQAEGENVHMHDSTLHMHDENVQMEAQNVHMHDSPESKNVHMHDANVQMHISQNNEVDEKQVFTIDCHNFATTSPAKNKTDSVLALSPSPSPSPSPLRKDTHPDSGAGGRAKVGKADFVQAVIEAYRTACPELPQPREVKSNSVLYRQISGRCRGERDRRKLSWWLAYWKLVAASSFLSGRKTEWRADAIWLTGQKNMEKVLSGNYDDRKNGAAQPRPAKGMSPVSPRGSFEDRAGFFEDAMVSGG